MRIHNPQITGSLTLSGSNINIDSAGTISGSITSTGSFASLKIANNVDIDGTTNIAGDATLQSDLSVVDINASGHITASSNISASGNLSITGNADIDGTLDVDGTSNLDDVDVDGYITASGNIGTDGNLYVTGNADVNGTTNLDDVDVDGYITASGNIGTDSKLFVTGTSDLIGNVTVGNASTDQYINLKKGNSDKHGVIRFYRESALEWGIGHSSGENGDAYAIAGGQDFGIWYGSTPAYALRIDTSKNSYFSGNISASGDLDIDGNITGSGATLSGNVGIGTAAPSEPLHVYESGDGITLLESTGHTQLTIKTTGTTDHTEINFGDSGDDDIGAIRYTHSSNALQFDTNTNERMRIDSSGNIAIGTTSAINDKLHVEGNMRVTGNLVALEFHTEFTSASVV